MIPKYIFDPTANFDVLNFNPNDIAPHLSGISNCDNGNTLHEIMSNIRSLPYEVFILFDRQMQKVYEHTDYKELTCGFFFPMAWNPHIKIYLHNHPTELNFSSKDFKAFQLFGCSSAIVVSQNFTYVLNNLPRNWATKAPEELKTPRNLANFIDSKCEFYLTQLQGDPILCNDYCTEQIINALRSSGLKTECSVYDKNNKLLFKFPETSICNSRDEFYKIVSHCRTP